MTEPGYLQDLQFLSKYIKQLQFPLVIRRFLYGILHPGCEIPTSLSQIPTFNSSIHVYHSAIARFYAPNDLCGAGGMSCEIICANPSWHRMKRYDTVFVALNDKPGMLGMVIACVLLFFHFSFAITISSAPLSTGLFESMTSLTLIHVCGKYILNWSKMGHTSLMSLILTQ